MLPCRQYPTPDYIPHGHSPPLHELCHPTLGGHPWEMLFLSYWGSNSPNWATPPHGLIPHSAQVLTLCRLAIPLHGCPPYSNQALTPSLSHSFPLHGGHLHSARALIPNMLGWTIYTLLGLSATTTTPWYTYIQDACFAPCRSLRSLNFSEKEDKCWNAFNIDNKRFWDIYKLVTYNFLIIMLITL